ncbi:11515_t:CDS:1, partial [Ambispora gerdemannii]
NSNDTPEQIVSRYDDTPVSDISDNASNSNESNNVLASDISDDTSNSGNTPDLSSEHILAQSKLPEDIINNDTAEILNFVETKYKEHVSEEIMERIREKKLWDQNLSSDISSSEEVVPEISAGPPPPKYS